MLWSGLEDVSTEPRARLSLLCSSSPYCSAQTHPQPLGSILRPGVVIGFPHRRQTRVDRSHFLKCRLKVFHGYFIIIRFSFSPRAPGENTSFSCRSVGACTTFERRFTHKKPTFASSPVMKASASVLGNLYTGAFLPWRVVTGLAPARPWPRPLSRPRPGWDPPQTG